MNIKYKYQKMWFTYVNVKSEALLGKLCCKFVIASFMLNALKLPKIAQNQHEWYRVTHMQVPLLQRFLFRVYEVFGVIMIIFIKYGLWTIDIHHNSRFYFHNMLKIPSFDFYVQFCTFDSIFKMSQKFRFIT